MYRVIYVSSETSPFSDQDLDRLLVQSRENNGAAEITGMLLYKEGNFMQYLEGPVEAVQKLVAKIRKDPRHQGFKILMEAEVQHRQFTDWSMGFKRLGPETSAEVAGYRDFDELALTSRQFLLNPAKSLKLLVTFKSAPSGRAKKK
jgi:hypothetical protein